MPEWSRDGATEARLPDLNRSFATRELCEALHTCFLMLYNMDNKRFSQAGGEDEAG